MQPKPTPPNPSGLCLCGCGQRTWIATINNRKNGWVKGQPVRFARGHSHRLNARDIEPPNPSGLCQCGCGQPAPIAASTWRVIGHVGGEPVRFVLGHNQLTNGGTGRLSDSMIHKHLSRDHPKSGVCEECGKIGKTDYAFKHHPAPHTRERADYRELCRACHFAFDEPLVQRHAKAATKRQAANR